MSETETVETETTETKVEGNLNDSINAPLEGVEDPAVLKKMIASLRQENAGARVKNKALDTEMAEYRAFKESQKSELQKALDAAEAAKKESAVKDELILRHEVQREHGIPDDMAEFLTGNKEEMVAKAEKIKVNLKTSVDSKEANVLLGNPLVAGRGAPVGKAGKTEGDWFGEFVAGKSR